MPQRSPDTASHTDDHTGLVTVEAATAEEAIAQVHQQLGASAEIVSADRVLRGGLWGFFPKQMVQLNARPAADATSPATAPPAVDEGSLAPARTTAERLAASRSAATEGARPVPRSARGVGPGPVEPAVPAVPEHRPTAAPSIDERAENISSVISRLSAEADEAEEGLGTALRRHLGVTIEDDAPRSAAGPAPEAPAASSGATSPFASATRVSTAEGWLRGLRGQPAADEETPVGLAAALASVEREPAPAPTFAPTVAEPAPVAEDPVGGEETVATEVTDAEPMAVHARISMDDVEFDGPAGSPWSGRGLLMLGLPRGLVDAVLDQEPADDAAWTYAVARALSPLCRPLPTGPSAIIGPRAEKLATATGVPLVRLSGSPRGTAAFAVACTDSARARAWLHEHRGQRWTYLVVGGVDWRGLLFEGPLAVSWVGDDMLGEALRAAHDLGMVLGSGVRSDSAGTLVEPSPIELAMLLRDMLGGRR